MAIPLSFHSGYTGLYKMQGAAQIDIDFPVYGRAFPFCKGSWFHHAGVDKCNVQGRMEVS